MSKIAVVIHTQNNELAAIKNELSTSKRAAATRMQNNAKMLRRKPLFREKTSSATLN